MDWEFSEKYDESHTHKHIHAHTHTTPPKSDRSKKIQKDGQENKIRKEKEE